MDNRKQNIVKFINHSIENPYFIEPDERLDLIKSKLDEAIHLFNPGKIIKIGLGRGEIAEMLAERAKMLIIVEYSFDAIKKFRDKLSNSPELKELLKKIVFINSEFENIAVDYHIADLLVCTDYFDFVGTAPAMEEIKRIIAYKGVFLFTGVVLHNDDVEGSFDETLRAYHPVHNDYYLPDDLDTYMKLKEFTPVKRDICDVRRKTGEMISNLSSYRNKVGLSGQNFELPYEYNESLVNYYDLKMDSDYKEYYMSAAFRKNYPADEMN